MTNKKIPLVSSGPSKGGHNKQPSVPRPDYVVKGQEKGDDDIIETIQHEVITPNSIFIVTIDCPYGISTDQNKSLISLGEFICNKGGMIVIVSPEVHISKVPEEQMNELGWFRK